MELKAHEILTTEYETLDYLENIEKAQCLFSKTRFLVILKNKQYFGLLTPIDISLNKKNLVGDCISDKPKVYPDQGLSSFIETFLIKGYRVLPCIHNDGSFCGVITIERALEAVCKIIIAEDAQKDSSLHEFSHNTRNPVQLIMSATNLLKVSKLNKEQILLVNEVEKATKSINSILTQFILKYFHS